PHHSIVSYAPTHLITAREQSINQPHSPCAACSGLFCSPATSVMGSPVSFPRELLLYVVAGAAIAWCAVRALDWAWWRPRRLDRALRSQGLRGTPYRSVAGDAPLAERLNEDARSRSMPLGCHDVVPRAMPLFHQTMKEHGTSPTSLVLFLLVCPLTLESAALVCLGNFFGLVTRSSGNMFPRADSVFINFFVFFCGKSSDLFIFNHGSTTNTKNNKIYI
uniref:Uncharacterized protein n=2 Tax=Aegilops tauschii subsp. strangulata TaxID=200361 RepID=A0A453F374_AEGTS